MTSRRRRCPRGSHGAISRRCRLQADPPHFVGMSGFMSQIRPMGWRCEHGDQEGNEADEGPCPEETSSRQSQRRHHVRVRKMRLLDARCANARGWRSGSAGGQIPRGPGDDGHPGGASDSPASRRVVPASPDGSAGSRGLQSRRQLCSEKNFVRGSREDPRRSRSRPRREVAHVLQTDIAPARRLLQDLARLEVR